MPSVQPIDIGAVTFKLRFNNTNREYWIDPPFDWDEMPLELKRQGKYARVIKFGQDKEITFVKHKKIEHGHQFDTLINYHKLYADEAFIELIIFVDDVEFLRAELDTVKAKTDRLNFYTCSLKVNDLNKKVEDLEDTKVSIFGNESLLGNYNEPAPFNEVTLLPKKIRERSKHEMGNEDNELMTTNLIDDSWTGVDVSQVFDVYNPWGFLQVDESDVAESYYVPLSQQYVNIGTWVQNNIPTTYTTGNLNNTHNLYFGTPAEVTLKAENIHIKVQGDNITNNNTLIRLQAAIITYDNADHDNIVDKHYVILYDTTASEVTINTQVSINVPRYTRVLYELRIFSSGTKITRGRTVTIYTGGSITADTIDIYPASKARMSRLIEVGKKILRNYTENAAIVNAPRFIENGEFWWYYITSGYFIRGFVDDTFDLSFKDWKEFIQDAFNSDVQINGNTVFIGKHEDFYRDQEIARFEFKPDTDSYEITVNEDLVVNKFSMKYNNFESDKKDTLDAFHTESEWFIPKRNKGILEAAIDFTADGYSIEYARREGINAEPTTAKQKDTDVYIIDCFVNRIWIPIINVYLNRLQNRQDQGFEIDATSVFSPETLYNVRLSLKRLILDNWSRKIAEIGQKLNNGMPIGTTTFLKNTFFKANGLLNTNATDSTLNTYQGWIREKNDVESSKLKTPLISPDIYTFTLATRLKYNQLINLYNKSVNQKGYITFYTADAERKIYPFDMSYDWVEEKLTIKGEEKYAV